MGTVTWPFEGRARHLDTLGSDQVIAPGELNVMYAGRPIAHAELNVAGVRRSHGLQLWLAQPERTRLQAPAFEHHSVLPRWEDGGVHHTLLMGELAGRASPARVDHPLVAAVMTVDGEERLPLRTDFEHAVFVVDGPAHVDGRPVSGGAMVYLGTKRDQLPLAGEGARLLLLGGLPLEQPIAMFWNFIGLDADEIDAFREAWNDGTLTPSVPGTELERLPSP